MHEVSIALAIVDEIDERSTALDGIVTAVHVRIGAMSAVVPSALEFAWDLATAGTAIAGARLVIERVPLTIACERCGNQVVDGPPIPICPGCSAPSSAIVTGRELDIAAVEVLDANPAR